MRPIRLVVLAVLLAAAPAVAGGASDAIKVFKSDFKPGKMESTRAAALAELATKADEAVLDAFEWARALTAREVLRLIIGRDDVLKALEPVEKAMAAAAKAAADAAKREGRPPPSTFPVDPNVMMKFNRLRQQADRLQGEIDTEYDLRDLAAEALGEWIGDLPDGIRAKVFKTLERRTLKSPDWAVRKFHAKGLGHAKALGATRLLLMRLEAERDRRVLPVVIDALSLQGGDVAVDHLLPFLADERWQIRAATVAALGRIRSPRAVEPLIARLREEDGRLRGDIAAALKEITGQDLGINPDRWKTWWDANRGSFGGGGKAPEGEGEGDGDAERPEAPPPPNVPSFYGIRVLSKRILFVIDISGSMTESAGKDRTKIDVAKYELKNAILGLGEGAEFNIVNYAQAVFVWRKGMVKAKGKDKRAAVKFIEKMEAVGATNIHGALSRAFHLVGLGSRDKNYEVGADTIFFLSDGQPTRGEILDPNKILACVKRWNSLRRVKIHTVGVGPGHDASFMRSLAESSGGKYVKR
ncbi:MAG: HEAT repeat domain-containing protein [Planctomycetota bacterium]